MLKFDDANLERVAALVYRFNPHATKFGSAGEGGCVRLVAYMKETAIRNLLDRDTYCATLGFMLTSFTPEHDPDHRYIKASLDTCLFTERDERYDPPVVWTHDGEGYVVRRD